MNNFLTPFALLELRKIGKFRSLSPVLARMLDGYGSVMEQTLVKHLRTAKRNGVLVYSVDSGSNSNGSWFRFCNPATYQQVSQNYFATYFFIDSKKAFEYFGTCDFNEVLKKLNPYAKVIEQAMNAREAS